MMVLDGLGYSQSMHENMDYKRSYDMNVHLHDRGFFVFPIFCDHYVKSIIIIATALNQ